MQPLTAEWTEKAEEDFISAQREYRARTRPNYNAACFFAQQCIEKYLKARLQEAGIEFSKTHDLVTLLDLVEPVEPFWQAYRPTFRFMSAYAVVYRYPGERSTREEALEAIRYRTNARSKPPSRQERQEKPLNLGDLGVLGGKKRKCTVEKEAIKICRDFRKVARFSLGLKEE